MGVTVELRVLELICSRICHDLVSPIGAINNGVELIEEMGPDMADEAMNLIGHSAEQASRRMRLFRLVYGSAGHDPGLKAADLQGVADGYFEGSKITLDWTASPLAAVLEKHPGSGKLLLALLLLADEGLVYGGTIAMHSDQDSLSVVASGRGASLKPETRDALQGNAAADALTPQSAHAYITRQFATQKGARIEMGEAADQLTLTVRF